MKDTVISVTSSSNTPIPSLLADAQLCCPPILSSRMSEGDAETLASIMKALADPTRLQLVSIIANAGEGCACDFPDLLSKSQPTISHHLRQLVDAGILDREQRGKWAWYTVSRDRLAQVCSILC